MTGPPTDPFRPVRASPLLAFAGGAAVGVLGGMIGLGGAEFRLPLLIALFGFAALQAVIVNKALKVWRHATADRPTRTPSQADAGASTASRAASWLSRPGRAR